MLQSLRQQTFEDWDLVVLDECQTPLGQCEFIMKLLSRIKMEDHGVNIIQNDLKLGVCHARNKLIKEDYFDNDFICRLDDDVIIEPDYIEKLMKVIDKGYDIASGVTPQIASDGPVRNVKKVGKVINRKDFDKEGNITYYGDDCGTRFLQDKILPTDEFRSCALIKKEVLKKVSYPTNLSPVGFREESFFSFKAISKGFKIGVHTGAIAYHFQCSTGGCRFPDYNEKVQSDNEYFLKWVKKLYNGNRKIFDKRH